MMYFVFPEFSYTFAGRKVPNYWEYNNSMKKISSTQNLVPGSLIKGALKSRKLSQKEFAKEVGVLPSHISEIINGKRKISLAFAQTIENTLEIPAQTLLSMQVALDIVRDGGDVETTEELEAKSTLEDINGFIDVKSLLKGKCNSKSTAVEKLSLINKYYGICSSFDMASEFSALENSCFRRSAKTGLDVRMINTWVVKAKSEAILHKPTVSFSLDTAEEICDRLVEVLHRNSSEDNIQNLLGEYGIGFCEVSKLPHASIDGYSFMDKGTPYIVITGRYDRIDNLAFTLMHEIAHIYLGHTTEQSANINLDLRSYCEDDYSSQEEEADKFASEKLISSTVWKLVPSIKVPSPWLIQSRYTSWAKKRNLNPWIVLGRLFHETGIYKFKSDPSRSVRIRKGGAPMVS